MVPFRQALKWCFLALLGVSSTFFLLVDVHQSEIWARIQVCYLADL
jgi:hypothetical protein